jgi:ABC-type proline/glycine betaine transport system substrate-binding protein
MYLKSCVCLLAVGLLVTTGCGKKNNGVEGANNGSNGNGTEEETKIPFEPSDGLTLISLPWPDALAIASICEKQIHDKLNGDVKVKVITGHTDTALSALRGGGAEVFVGLREPFAHDREAMQLDESWEVMTVCKDVRKGVVLTASAGEASKMPVLEKLDPAVVGDSVFASQRSSRLNELVKKALGDANAALSLKVLPHEEYLVRMKQAVATNEHRAFVYWRPGVQVEDAKLVFVETGVNELDQSASWRFVVRQVVKDELPQVHHVLNELELTPGEITEVMTSLTEPEAEAEFEQEASSAAVSHGSKDSGDKE